jgi:hypothetical protein
MASAAAATLSAVKTAVSKKSHVLGKVVVAPASADVAPLVPKEPVVQCHWWNGVYDSVLNPSTFLVDGGGKLKEADLDSDSLIGQELREKFDATGLVHVQNTVSTNLMCKSDVIIGCNVSFFNHSLPIPPPHRD